MFRSILLVAVSAVAVVNAQNYSTSGPLSIDASQIPATLRASWCLAQTNNCPDICGGRATTNTCDSTDLTYDCVCPDGQARNISAYEETIPFFVCQQWIANCLDNHPNDRDGQAGCNSVTCGSLNASEAVASTSSASTTASATTSATTTGATGTGASTTGDSTASATATPSGAASALNVAQNYGTGVLALVGAAVFGLAM